MQRPTSRTPHFQPPTHLRPRYVGDDDFRARRTRGELLGRSGGPAGLQNPSLVNSADGAIASILLTIPSASVSYPEFANLYRNLLQQLPPHANCVMLTHQASLAMIERWPEVVQRRDSIQLIQIQDEVNFTDWAEDPYVAVGSDDGPAFVEPFAFHRFADSLTAEAIAPRIRFEVGQAPLYFQGGNLLIGDNFFFIGGDYPERSLGYIPDVIRPQGGESDRELIARLFSKYLDSSKDMITLAAPTPLPPMQYVLGKDDQGHWVEQHYAGNEDGTVQPIFHIDMFMSLAGRDEYGVYQVLVGDPSEAANLLGETLWAHSLQETFDAFAEQVDALPGFCVIRNPLPLTFLQKDVSPSHFRDRDDEIFRELTAAGVDKVPLFQWYFATSNNALVEITDSSKKVWLPTYGHGGWSDFAVIDQEQTRIWTGLGFDVNPLGDFHPFAQLQGAVHCISKYLRRD